ncbi:MAG: hypothetical protein AB8B94_13340 [Hyphomicrobiales bacterium]
MIKFRTAILAALLVSSSPFGGAFANDLLAKAEGSWKGKGWFKNGLNAPKEIARCRYKNSMNASKNSLKITGKCSTANRTFNASGTITVADKPGRFSGVWNNPRGLGIITLAGKQSGGRINFTFQTKEQTTSKQLPHRSNWSISKSKLKLVGSVKDPKTGKYSNLSVMEFSR